MPTIGEQLRLAREKQGRSISDLATATCISSRYLAAIEGDDRKILPGDFFYRNFVKQYARALGLDSKPLVRELDSILPREDGDVLPVLSEVYIPPGRMSRPKRTGLIAAVLLVGAIAGGSGLYAWWEKAQRKDPAAMAVEKKVEVPPKPAAVQPTPEAVAPPATPTQDAATASTPPVAAPTAVPESQGASGPGVVKLAATEKTWVSVSTNGKTVFSGVLEPAETRQFAGVENGKVVTGNAGGVDVEWNGKAIGPIGPRGQVRTVLLSGESFQILGPAPARRM